MSKAYYNEHDPKKAAWIRELIKADLIAPGDVDERSIEDVLPIELAGYTQCHFFAGIAVWSYALRCAGWSDNRKVWTGSCPCQPFSAAGEGKGFADERHLWPAWFHLIQQCRPDVVFGEQVESKDGRTWLDLVQSDLEASAYAIGPVGLCAAGFGAPHIRGRIFFVADAARDDERWKRQSGEGIRRGQLSAGRLSSVGVVANANGGNASTERKQRSGQQRQQPKDSRTGEWLADAANVGHQRNGQSWRWRNGLTDNGEPCQLGNAKGDGWIGRQDDGNGWRRQCSPGQASAIDGLDNAIGDGWGARRHDDGRNDRIVPDAARNVTNGFWREAEWLYCRDGKYRPTQPGVFPLAHGVANRMVKLRGCGDAIVASVAEEFIRAYIEVREVA